MFGICPVRAFILQFAVFYLVATASPASLSASAVRTVAFTGGAAPGTGIDTTFSAFLSDPAINTAGKTAFHAQLTGSSVDFRNNQSIWSEGSGTLSLVARGGDRAPATPNGVLYRDFGSPVLNSSGQTAFRARTIGNGIPNPKRDGIWSEGLGSLDLVAREHEPAPGTTNGEVFNSVGHYSSITLLSDSGHTAFGGSLIGGGADPSNRRGIWSNGTGSTALVARGGEQAPGTPPGVRFGGILGTETINSAGHTAFSAFLSGGDVGRGIWSDRSGSLGANVLEGDQVPGLMNSVTFSGFSNPKLNSTDQIAFIGSISGAGIDVTNDDGIWSEGNGTLALVARTGDQAPGAPDGVEFSRFAVSMPLLNANGQTAFIADLTGTGVNESNESGIWSENSGSLALVARAGDPAPGTAGDAIFGSFSLLNVNSAGQTAFLAVVTGEGVDHSNSYGFWAEDRAGILRQIARVGNSLQVGPGDVRTITRLSMHRNSGNDEGRPSAFNDLGQLAFRADFADGTQGIFISDLATLPEPATAGMLILGFIAFSFKRHLAVS